MVIVRNVKNPFKPDEAEIKALSYSRAKTLEEFLAESEFDYKDKRVIVSGKKVERLNMMLDNDDEITIIPDVKAPVVAAVSAIVSFVWTAIAAHPFVFTFFVLAVGYSVYQYMNKPRTPSFDMATPLGGGSLDEGSPTYGWDGVQTMQEVGVPIAVIYGEHKVGGNIINQHIFDDGDKSYLNILLALGEGEIESIDNIEINDNPIENFSSIETEKRYGSNVQGLIKNFEDLHNLYTVNVNLTKDNPHVYTTIDSDVEAFEVHLRLPSGLYQQSSGSGSISSWSVTYKVEYKLHADPDYIDLGETTISEKSRSTLRRVFRKTGLTPGKYDIRLTRTSDDSTLDPLRQGDLTWFQVDEIKTDDLMYPNTALLGLKLLATDQLSGSTPNITSIVKGKKIRVPDIRNASTPVAWDDYYWDGENYRLLSDDTVLTWDGVTYVTKYSANPVWCVRDFLINSRYGLGEFISNLNLNDASFLEMSRYCEEKVPDGKGSFEKRFRLDVVIDSNTKALDLLIQLSATFNAMPVYSGGAISFKIDKKQLPTQAFGMGNIIKDSFVQSWKTLKEIPNVIEVQFMDKEKGYRQETVACIDEDSLIQGEPMRKAQLRLFTTQTSYAIRAGRYALKVAKYINRSVSFKAGIDAIACQAGDIISVSHDVPQWGFSGRVKAGSTTVLVKLDRTVLIEDGKSYKIQARFKDDTLEEKTVTSPQGTFTEVECEAFSRAPEDFDVFLFGEVNKVKKDFRVVSIQKEGHYECRIQALEYNENVYDDSDIILPQNNYSSLSGEIPSVENLRLTESLVKKQDGTIENSIEVWFEKPTIAGYYVKSFRYAKVYLSDNGGQSYAMKGETTGTHFMIIGDIVDGEEYKVKVVSVTDMGEEGDFASSPEASITIIGKSAPPSDVENFLVNQSRDMLYFGWTDIPDVDVWGYEIRRGADWDGGEFVTFQQGTHYLTRNFRKGYDQSYWIKAIDTSRNYSENAKEAVITITNIPFRNIIAEFQEYPDWPGVRDNLDISLGFLMIASGQYEGSYTTPVRDIGYVATAYLGIDGIVTIEEGRRFDSDPLARFNSSPSFRFTGQELLLAATFKIRTSKDNITWTDWEDYQAGDYNMRYFQLKMTLKRENLAEQIICSSLGYYGDLPDVDEYGHDIVTDADSGKAVYFTKIYHEEPNVHIEIRSGDGVYAKFLDKSTLGFTVKLYDGQGVAKTGSFDWHSHGI
jgi:predicted phage tail protein